MKKFIVSVHHTPLAEPEVVVISAPSGIIEVRKYAPGKYAPVSGDQVVQLIKDMYPGFANKVHGDVSIGIAAAENAVVKLWVVEVDD